MEENTKELNIVREINAPTEQVFKAWTDPEILKKWWGPNGVTNSVRELDLKPNGLIDIVMLAGSELGDLEGSEWPMTGIFQEITPPTKLVYTSSAIIDGQPILDTLNTLILEDHEGKTKMTFNVKVTRTTPQAEGPLAGMEMGWNQSIDKLIKHLQKNNGPLAG
jgi:uncharacterized protein YndB with AHSA1/START domain